MEEIINLILHLIGDLLYTRKPVELFKFKYSTFINKIKSFEKFDIVTLNHDYLMEMLLKENSIYDYSDGFSRNQEVLYYSNKPLNVFLDKFNSEKKLIKLHGSLNIFRYNFYRRMNGPSIEYTGEYLYFKTNDYREKQLPERYDPDTKEKVQTFHFNIYPELLTGINKQEKINSDIMFSKLFQRFEEAILQNEELLIIGYSYSDKHVNSLIIKALKHNKIKKIINVNPNISFPYSDYSSNVIVKNIKFLNEL